MIEAKCRCGFESGTIMQGGGMLNFETIDYEPAICLKCKKFLVLNYKIKNQKCPDCNTEIVFYNDKSVQRKTKSYQKKIPWGAFYVPDTTCLCPRCGKLTMRFYFRGYWD
jgi:hypothetical protein